MSHRSSSTLMRCERGTVTIIFAVTFSILLALILAGLELARVQREAGQISAALTAAADEIARGLSRGIERRDLADRARAAFQARMPGAPQSKPIDLKIEFDESNRRVVARTTWDIETAFGRRTYALAGDARLRAARKPQR